MPSHEDQTFVKKKQALGSESGQQRQQGEPPRLLWAWFPESGLGEPPMQQREPPRLPFSEKLATTQSCSRFGSLDEASVPSGWPGVLVPALETSR